MGLLVVGLAFIVGLGLASVLGKSKDQPATGSATARVGAYPAIAEPLKARPGDAVASFPHGQWGQVVEVNGGADGGYRYVVGFQNGATVELRGAEFTR